MEQFLRNHWAGLMARVRHAYWKHRLNGHPSQFTVYGKILIRHPQRVHLGSNVRLSEGVYINARDNVYLGDHSCLSAYVRINTGALPLDVRPEERETKIHTSHPVHIGAYVWLATGVIINPGVTVNEGTVVGAGAVVVNDLPAYTLCVGVPARPIRHLMRPDGTISTGSF